MHNTGYKSALARRACRYSDARPPRKTDGVLLESEIPPHMRGKDIQERPPTRTERITPAYAGKSERSAGPSLWTQDHPRVCGEKPFGRLCLNLILGSPPRMRGKGFGFVCRHCEIRITPAYAGKSFFRALESQRSWDHPRVCGEKSVLRT